MIKHYVIIGLLLTLTACTNKDVVSHKVEDEPCMYNLDNSTQIIVQLIEQGDLAKITEKTSVDSVDRLIKNFSPAEMALEVEVLNWEQPVIMFFIGSDVEDYQKLEMMVDAVARKHKEIKFVEIDSNELFKLSDIFDIKQVPALLLMYQRKEIVRAEGLNTENVEQKLQELIATKIP